MSQVSEAVAPSSGSSPPLVPPSSSSATEEDGSVSRPTENGDSSEFHEKNTTSEKERAKEVGQEHSFLMDRSDVEQMEQGLLNLLDDFKHGRLHAFGGEFSMEKMNRVRNLQVTLAQLHFDLEEEETILKEEQPEDGEERKGHEKLDKLMKNLENLCSSLQSLHQPDKE